MIALPFAQVALASGFICRSSWSRKRKADARQFQK
jgi:hypothetical protein